MSTTRPPCWMTAYPREQQSYETMLHAVHAALVASGQIVRASEFLERSEKEIPLDLRGDYGELMSLAIEYVEIV